VKPRAEGESHLDTELLHSTLIPQEIITRMNTPPIIIQEGMGAGVSNWRLANAVSQIGKLGVVSETALDQIFSRRLQDGDPGGHMRRGLDHFPVPEMAERLWRRHYIPGGKSESESYKTLPKHTKDSSRELIELCIVANFVEVFLASEGHHNPVGINYLEKIQIPHLPSLCGVMLAGVGYVLMGAISCRLRPDWWHRSLTRVE